VAQVAYDQSTVAQPNELRVLGTHLDGFLDPRSSPVAKLAEGGRLRVAEIGRLLVPGMFKAYSEEGRWLDWNTLVYVPVFAIVITGWLAMARRCPDGLLLSLPAYLLVYALWPFDAGTRYLLPMLPVLVVSLWPWLERSRHPRTLLAALLVAHFAVTLGYTITREIPRARECDRQWPAAMALAAEMRAEPHPALARSVPECTALLLSFALDRPVLR